MEHPKPDARVIRVLDVPLAGTIDWANEYVEITPLEDTGELCGSGSSAHLLFGFMAPLALAILGSTPEASGVRSAGNRKQRRASSAQARRGQR